MNSGQTVEKIILFSNTLTRMLGEQLLRELVKLYTIDRSAGAVTIDVGRDCDTGPRKQTVRLIYHASRLIETAQHPAVDRRTSLLRRRTANVTPLLDCPSPAAISTVAKNKH